MLENLRKFQIILASQSPRRRSLLKMLDIDFETISLDVDESLENDIDPEKAAVYLAEKKAKAFLEKNEIDKKLVITADTIVYLDNEILGKPNDHEDAFRIISSLSGKWHKVISGVCLISAEKQRSFSSITDVHFKVLSDEEINYYIEKYKPYDKAGAYGIQEWIGYIGIDRISGSFYNVMGLPVQKLYEELKKF